MAKKLNVPLSQNKTENSRTCFLVYWFHIYSSWYRIVHTLVFNSFPVHWVRFNFEWTKMKVNEHS